MNPAARLTAAPVGDPSLPLAGYRRLAIRVIQQALRDLHCGSPDLQQSARVFLGGHPLLFLWCDLAEIGPARVMARAAAEPLWPRRRRGPASSGSAETDYASTAGAKLASARASVS